MTTTSLLIVSVIVVACLTATATAIRTVSRIWLRHWVERRLSGAAAAALYLDRPQRLIMAATTAVAITVFLSGTFIGATVSEGLGQRARIIVLYAAALLVAGQLVPRALARRWPSVIVPPLLPVVRLIEFGLMPVLALVRRLTGETARDDNEPAVTDSEALEELLREGELEGVGEHTEIAIIEGVVQFGEKAVKDVMTPRSDIFAVDADDSVDEQARRIAQSGYSRVPVYKGTLDTITGMLHTFDVFKHDDSAPPLLRRVGVAAPNSACNDLLFRMLRERTHLAIVRDDAGVTHGIVTLEDLLEELVGDIRDEHDDPSGPRPPAPVA